MEGLSVVSERLLRKALGVAATAGSQPWDLLQGAVAVGAELGKGTSAVTLELHCLAVNRLWTLDLDFARGAAYRWRESKARPEPDFR